MSMTSDGEWGEGFVPGTFEDAMRATEAEGNTAMIRLWSSFSVAIEQPDAAELLPFVVVPSEVPRVVAALPQLRAELADRGMTNRPEIVAPDVAYLKLVPSPPESLVAVTHVRLPESTIFATLLRCPDLPDLPDHSFEHWRVFDVGDAVPLAEIPSREV